MVSPTGLAEVSVVITTHDAGDALQTTLESLLEAGPFASVHVVDSGSQDGSVAAAERRFPQVRVTRLGSNLGPCATRNLGLREAETPYVLLLDDDMTLAPDAPERLLAALQEDSRRAMVGPRILHAEEGAGLQYEGGFWHYAGLTHMRGQDGRAPDDEMRSVDVLTSGCVLVRREAVLDAGGFDESLFFLMEDVELCLRLRWLGWSLVTVPTATATNRGASEGISLDRDGHSERRLRLHARNRILIVLGLYDLRSLLLLWPGILLLDAAWLVFSCLAGHPLAFVRGKIEILPRLPAVLRKRRAFLGRKVLSDREVLAAPPLTLTPAARRRPLTCTLTRFLDLALRQLLSLVRGVLP